MPTESGFAKRLSVAKRSSVGGGRTSAKKNTNEFGRCYELM